MLPKLQLKDANQMVYDELKKAIISGLLTSGSPLVERELAAHLGVSRTPVHEAINRLEAEHLVQRLPNKRTVVARISEQDLVQLYTIRTQLEELAISWAMPHLDDEVLEKLRDNLRRMAHYGNAGDAERIAGLNTAFHNIIVETSRSWYLSAFMENIQDAVRLFRGHAVYLPGRVEHILDEHTRLVQALEARDEEAALKHIRAHVWSALEALLAQYRTEKPENA